MSHKHNGKIKVVISYPFVLVVCFWFLAAAIGVVILLPLLGLPSCAIKKARAKRRPFFLRWKRRFLWAAGIIWGGYGSYAIGSSSINDRSDDSLLFTFFCPALICVIAGFYCDAKAWSDDNLAQLLGYKNARAMEDHDSQALGYKDADDEARSVGYANARAWARARAALARRTRSGN